MSTRTDFPFPARRGQVIIREHGAVLPTVPGMATGIVDDRSPDVGVTVQCAVCLRTATGAAPTAGTPADTPKPSASCCPRRA